MDEVATSTTVGTIVAMKAFDIPELAEHIFLHLEPAKILQIQATCKTFEAQIKSSNKLRTKVMMSGTPVQCIVAQQMKDIEGTDGVDFIVNPLLTAKLQAGDPDLINLDFLALPQDKYRSYVCTDFAEVEFYVGDHVNTVLHPASKSHVPLEAVAHMGSWTEMYLTYPLTPITIYSTFEAMEVNTFEQDPVLRGPITKEMVADFALRSPGSPLRSATDQELKQMEDGRNIAQYPVRLHKHCAEAQDCVSSSFMTLSEIWSYKERMWIHIGRVSLDTDVKPCRVGDLLKIITELWRLSPRSRYYGEHIQIGLHDAKRALAANGVPEALISLVIEDVEFSFSSNHQYWIWESDDKVVEEEAIVDEL